MAALTGTMTELEAVNLMLRYVGEQPVATIGASLSESYLAQQVLDEVNRSIQSEGLHCNTVEDVELTSSGGTVTVPNNTLAIDPSAPGTDYVLRGTTLYDRTNNTATISQNVDVDMTVLLDFDDLPQHCKKYIAMRAAETFYIQMIGAVQQDSLLQREVARARENFYRQEADVAESSIFNNNSAGSVVNRHFNGLRVR